MDPAKYKDIRVTHGHTYHYYYNPAAPGKPTLFFIHGFPSSSFEWSRQVAFFQPKGYGLLMPDTLGYGGSSKPEDIEEFRLKLQAQDLMEILDAENPSTVIGVGHDWGSIILSAVSRYYQDRFAGFVWLVLCYTPPLPGGFDLDGFIKQMRQLVGYDVYGYWTFWPKPGAHLIVEKNLDCFLHLTYPKDPAMWREWAVNVGKAQEWYESGRTPGYAAWLTETEYATIRATLVKGGLKSPITTYRAYIANINVPDDKELPEENWYVKKPALFVGASQDCICISALGKAQMQKYAPQADFVELDTGHWVHLEATDRLNTELERWIEKLPLV